MNYDLLEELIGTLKKFEAENTKQNVNLNDFREYLNELAFQKESPKRIIPSKGQPLQALNNDLCKQLIMTGRFAKLALKKGMAKFPELINEDFTYLYRLSDYPCLNKMQLIEKNAHEKQYGLVIIRRLIQNGLIQEKENPKDKREKLIAVTPKGQQLIADSMSDVNRTATLIGGNLSEDEKDNLLNLLKKLNNFHSMIYTQYKNESIEDIENANLI
ncbi:MarR family transcriptional regulator [Ornithobacterium rhinotracheale]|uniref:winged helix DNA-binding protein n=1 Tax=Ornithobacterium rhinotracheale TaxID=28251 RepID=UPI00129C5463|nr:winged helix DNA-binding protein [Ornithobacterium rhinotracheale]MRJ10461.1 MarR family transcriptional regulator [Ornithobacterium rhinotracheale]